MWKMTCNLKRKCPASLTALSLESNQNPRFIRGPMCLQGGIWTSMVSQTCPGPCQSSIWDNCGASEPGT
ncbi:uncharacterized [Tachysurus ichikawai]